VDPVPAYGDDVCCLPVLLDRNHATSFVLESPREPRAFRSEADDDDMAPQPEMVPEQLKLLAEQRNDGTYSRVCRDRRGEYPRDFQGERYRVGLDRSRFEDEKLERPIEDLRPRVLLVLVDVPQTKISEDQGEERQAGDDRPLVATRARKGIRSLVRL